MQKIKYFTPRKREEENEKSLIICIKYGKVTVHESFNSGICFKHVNKILSQILRQFSF